MTAGRAPRLSADRDGWARHDCRLVQDPNAHRPLWPGARRHERRYRPATARALLPAIDAETRAAVPLADPNNPFEQGLTHSPVAIGSRSAMSWTKAVADTSAPRRC